MMETDILENATDLHSVRRGFECKNFSPDDFISIKFSTETDIVRLATCGETRNVMANAFEFQFVTNPATKISITLKNTGNEIISQFDPSNNLNFSLSTNDHKIKEETEISRFLATSFLQSITFLENEKRKKEAIKEIHKMLENLLTNKSFDIVNQMFLLITQMEFSLSVIVAFLAASLDFKLELQNRSLLFENAEKIALKEFGKEKLNNSIFSQLK